MNTGGAETFLMKMFRNIDREKYMMDFCVVSKENYYEEEIKKLGGERMFYIPLKSKQPIKSFNAIKKIVKENNYNYVIRVNEHSLSTIDLLAAKMGGAKVLAMRSSNASSGSKLSILLHKMFIFLSKNVPNVKFAPSKLAAEYTFGKKCIENNKAFLLNNGLDTKQFTYSKDNRFEIRRKLGIENKIVVGHIGRFDIQKNHEFLIDLFLFPSFYEGMPNTVIEAQTTGLPCLISDSITEEARITDIVNFASLNDSARKWSNECLNILNKKYLPRENYSRIMKDKGYDTDDCAKKFIEIIFNSND